jgi:hypothetical protein
MKSGQLQIKELTTILNQHFCWNNARIACLVGMLIALMGGTVNMTQLALSFPSRAQVPSRYRRMQRFFSGHWIDYPDVALYHEAIRVHRCRLLSVTEQARQFEQPGAQSSQRFISQFGKSRIKGLLADREFIRASWMNWLIQEQIPFFIRIRNNSISTNRRS